MKRELNEMNPKVFLCHSSNDKEIAERLAKDLMENAIDVWYDKWEIKPGDSLRRKIDEGIEEATHFFVLLSKFSLKSEWVQTELDAGMVKRIDGRCRLVPILLEIDDKEVPPTLKGMRWERLDDYGGALRSIINTCFEVSTKPRLGEPPSWVRPLSEGSLGLSPNAEAVALFIAQRSEHALYDDPIIRPQEIEKALGMTQQEIGLAADELEEEGLAVLTKTTGMGKAGFTDISPQSELFFRCDPTVKGWNSEKDAKVVAAYAVNKNSPYVRSSEIAEGLKWEPRRLNVALRWLDIHDLAEKSEALGSAPYYTDGIIVTNRTKRYAQT
jgi:hypothetical protein